MDVGGIQARIIAVVGTQGAGVKSCWPQRHVAPRTPTCPYLLPNRGPSSTVANSCCRGPMHLMHSGHVTVFGTVVQFVAWLQSPQAQVMVLPVIVT